VPDGQSMTKLKKLLMPGGREQQVGVLWKPGGSVCAARAMMRQSI